MNTKAIRQKLQEGITEKHTGKMEGMQSLSTCCLLNPYCKKRRENNDLVCSNCYAWSILNRYKGLREKLERNTRILTTYNLRPCDVPVINAKYFRLESFGELINPLQVKNYFTIARNNRQTRFVLWSKQPDIIQAAIKKYHVGKPSNMTIIYSSPEKNVPATDTLKEYRFIDKLFTVYEKEFAKENDTKINCGSKRCIDCRICYGRNKKVFINELLK